ncbi:hypothetical protein GVO57_09600 [Sphingomonas changnyeongensis]|uniref:DUF3618 domain-containing protein n=1 Tax=Sphingomonas changnyeongensis TaxID=2698679 RepID=A0A7Z2NWH7_9SPHN|nr:hypothetical protein [Sphingomonas changnyeongensis]QHL91027.1 hypothetical protein GVO57_09600 [Sphingomonas changnyeongensis]
MSARDEAALAAARAEAEAARAQLRASLIRLGERLDPPTLATEIGAELAQRARRRADAATRAMAERAAAGARAALDRPGLIGALLLAVIGIGLRDRIARGIAHAGKTLSARATRRKARAAARPAPAPAHDANADHSPAPPPPPGADEPPFLLADHGV